MNELEAYEYIKTQIDIQKEIANLKADIYIVVAFGQILPKEVLISPKKGSWNIHASLLPKWRGAAPINRSIITYGIRNVPPPF